MSNLPKLLKHQFYTPALESKAKEEVFIYIQGLYSIREVENRIQILIDQDNDQQEYDCNRDTH